MIRKLILGFCFLLAVVSVKAFSLNGISIESPREQVVVFIDGQQVCKPTFSCFVANLNGGSYRVQVYAARRGEQFNRENLLLDERVYCSSMRVKEIVIEGANQLTQETVEFLDKAMEFRTDGLTVIIEDEKIGMRKLMARFPKFAKKFTSMINIPVFTNDELVNFARVYTKENGFKIDQMGMLALYNLIGVNQKEDQPMNIGAVKEMLDNAMARSQGGLLKFN